MMIWLFMNESDFYKLITLIFFSESTLFLLLFT